MNAQFRNIQKGFIGSLFDFSFENIITTKIIKVLYVLAMILITLDTIAWIIIAFRASAALGAFTLVILGPLGFLFQLIVARVWLEFVMAVFAIQENTGRIPPVAWFSSLPRDRSPGGTGPLATGADGAPAPGQ